MLRHSIEGCGLRGFLIALAFGSLFGPALGDERSPNIKVHVPGSVLHAVEGINFGNDGYLYGTSIHAQAVYRIDTKTGKVEVAVPSPDGESDDVAIGPAGTAAADIMAWTAQTTGEIRIQRPGGKPEVILRNAPRVNPIAFTSDGRLFTAQSGAGENKLWELDVVGNKPPRIVTQGKGPLNGFGFGPDGRLYAPHFGTDELLAVDPETGSYTVIAKGVGTTAAAKPDGKGHVFSVDYMRGDVWRTSIATGQAQLFTQLPNEVLDSLAFAKDGTIFLASAADSRILALDPITKKTRTVVDGRFTIALGAHITSYDGRESLIVADPFGYRFVDTSTGLVTRPAWAANRGASSAVAATDSRIAFSYALSNRVRVIDRATDRIIVETRAIAAPRGLAISADGSVLVADAAGNRIVRLKENETLDVATGLRHPVAVVLEAENSLLVSEYGTGTISRVDLRTGQRTQLIDGLQKPAAMARLADGRIAVVEPDKNTVTAIDLDTGARTVLASGLALSLAELHLPNDTNTGIAVGRDGAIYVTCPGDNSVVKITL